MDFTFEITVSCEHTEGKFAGRDELSELVTQELDAANPGTVYAENGGTYDVTDWTISDITLPPAKRRRSRSQAV